jgi:hypothetical protein
MVEEQTRIVEVLIEALERSIQLQSHYARLLNQYDQGRRLQFESAIEWIARLYTVDGQGMIKPRPEQTRAFLEALQSLR